MNQAIMKIRKFFKVENGCIDKARSTPNKHGKQFIITQRHDTISEIWRFEVDGCLCSDNSCKKCDYAFLIEPNSFYYFVELKGGNVKEATEQLFNTIDLFHQALEKGKKCVNFEACIVSSCYPKEDNAVRNARTKLKKEYNADIVVKVSQLERTI